MLWLILLVVAVITHAIRWGFWGKPRYPLHLFTSDPHGLLELGEIIVSLFLLMSFAFSVHSVRVSGLRVFGFLLTVSYHTLITLWTRLWWRARLWNTLAVICYVFCLWWLVMLYKDAGQIQLALTFFCACYKSIDAYIVYKK
jgi:hypothetical protein